MPARGVRFMDLCGRAGLPAGDVAVGTAFGAAHQGAVFQFEDHLTPSEGHIVQRHLDIVSPQGQLLGDLIGEAVLHLEGLALDPLPAGSIQRLLGIEMEVHQVHHHLHMALGLHIAAHHAEGAHRFAVL